MVDIQIATFLLLGVVGVAAQQVGTYIPENHPLLATQSCTASGGCTTSSSKIVLDANRRWIHSTLGTTSCLTANGWDPTLCPDGITCANYCALDGVSYSSTYGITTSGSALRLQFVTGTNIGSRVFLMADDTHYRTFQLLNQELAFDVDVSKLPCGLNGALYFVAMDADGGKSKYPGNRAGAKYGTGYCDSQCPRDVQFINGQANVQGWNATSATTGTGSYGSCCTELDIWEANSNAAALTPHTCTNNAQTRCSGSNCTSNTGFCDADGCDFNSFRLGNTTFLGAGMSVDTTKTFTVVTQFITSDNTSTGNLTEIRRFYVQNGNVIPNSVVNVTGIGAVNSITDPFCSQQKKAFIETNYFAQHGGLAQLGQALRTGMVLAFSISDDPANHMLWLDSNFPPSANPAVPGVARGMCSITSGNPADVGILNPSPYVSFLNIKFGSIGTTFRPA
uniref:Glucanase n=1 Tax=Phanerodontia chrysosporium TaxID=2822231 RepID=Q01762_PHACH|nr:cellulase [Phanerodontia chrysosporium]